MNILMLMTGSIACAKATALISKWTKNGHDITVVASQSALQFVGIATLEGLSNNPVETEVFAEGKMMQHINLSRKADMLIILPATANCLNKIASGIADDIVTTTWLAALELQKPMYIVPAMNTKMWQYPATQNSIAKLKSWNVVVLMPISGTLACNEVGDGRMMEVEDIDAAIMHNSGKQILITAGGTREYIDGVRYIGNLSSGKTGALMADYFTSMGYNVTWIGATNAQLPRLSCTKNTFETFAQLQSLIKNALQTNHYTCVLHAAAISDFYVSEIKLGDKSLKPNRETKLPTCETMTLQLHKNPKLVSQLKTWSCNQEIKIIAFKLTNTSDNQLRVAAVNKLIKQRGIDCVVHNDLTEITANQHPFNFYQSIHDIKACANTTQLCQNILEHLA